MSAPDAEAEWLRSLPEITPDMLGIKFAGWADDKWSEVEAAIVRAGGRVPNHPGLRLELADEINAILGADEGVAEQAKSEAALAVVGTLAHDLRMKITEVTGASHRVRVAAFGLNSRSDEIHDQDVERAIGKLDCILSRLATLRPREEEEDQRAGRPKDALTIRWASRLSKLLERSCGIRRRDARGRGNSRMVTLLDVLWRTVNPPNGGRDNRRAIQLALSKLPPQHRMVEDPLRDEP